MTSKEALEEIKDLKIVRLHETSLPEMMAPIYEFFKEQTSIIEKDLEVLEILKENNLLEYLIEKELFETANSYCGNTNKERERVKDYRNKLNKIKEWLKNESNND